MNDKEIKVLRHIVAELLNNVHIRQKKRLLSKQKTEDIASAERYELQNPKSIALVCQS